MATQFGPATAFAIAAAAGVLYGLGVLALRLPAARPTTRTPISRSARCGMLLMALGLAISGVSWTPAVALISFGVSGMGMTLAFTSIITQIQDRSPDELRGRIMALWFVAFLGAPPLRRRAERSPGGHRQRGDGRRRRDPDRCGLLCRPSRIVNA